MTMSGAARRPFAPIRLAAAIPLPDGRHSISGALPTMPSPFPASQTPNADAQEPNTWTLDERLQIGASESVASVNRKRKRSHFQELKVEPVRVREP